MEDMRLGSQLAIRVLRHTCGHYPGLPFNLTAAGS